MRRRSGAAIFQDEVVIEKTHFAHNNDLLQRMLPSTA
jgi:hypothetical protein